MTEKKYIASMTGYKATNADLTCQGFVFEIGKWYEHDGEIELCKSGFHFCVYPSGPWNYYSDPETRIFKVEAEQVLEVPTEAGADFKLVAKRIRLVEEITPGSKTKDNTGNSNTGNSNTGDRNTGDRNTGDRNTGYRNTGNSNTGNSNTGDSNTGDRNTGDSNTGDRNTGYRNTGDSNTGNRNTGDSNATDFSTGFFCQKEPKVICFDAQTKLTRNKFYAKYPEYYKLGELLLQPEKISFEQFKNLPGITKSKLESLHKKHLAAINHGAFAQ